MLNSIIRSWGPLAAARLSTRSIFFNPQSWLLLLLFFIVRILSFLLTDHLVIQAFIVFALIMILGIVYFKSQEHAWMLILTEIFLGGSGHMFEFFGLSIRTILITTFISLWVFFTLANSKYRNQLHLPHRLFMLFVPLFILVHISAIIGLIHGHDFAYVIQDLIPFAFLFLLLPSYHLFKSEKMQHYFVRLLLVFLIGSAVFALTTFILYSTGIAEIHEPFYKWFRDVAAGKITMVTPHFYRIVLPEHLVIAPAALVILSLLTRDEKHHPMWRVLLFLGMLILALNLSRSYMLGFVVGMFVLLYTHKFKEWIKEVAWTILVFLIIFTGINFISSSGQHLGLDMLGVRVGSLVNPETETSSLTRTQLVEPILQSIRQHPIIGNGLGATITYIDPQTFTPIKTNQFDWGYLELLSELGPLGLLYFMTVVGFILFEFIKKISFTPDYHDLKVGLLGGLIALMVINLTSPALFHVFGVFYLVFVTAFISKPLGIFDTVTTILYRVFNKITHS